MRTHLTALLACLALVAAACGGGDSDDSGTAAGDEPAEITTVEDDGGEAAESGTDAGATDIDFELFSSDEGAGCAVYVSVPEADATGDLRALAWQGVVSQDFTECGFSDVVEIGVLTVTALDSYDQPDFSQTIEHVYFAVDGWDALVADCFELELSADCSAQLAASFTE